MSIQEGATTVDDLIQIIAKLAKEMKEFSSCNNAIRKIEIRIDEDDNSFIITSVF